jgi:apolipoprotein N-acyltransferase
VDRSFNEFEEAPMPKRPLGLLSFGIFVVIVAILLVALGTGYIKGWDAFLSLLLAFYGIWTLILSEIRAIAPEKYERGAFSTFLWGYLFTLIGAVWYLAILQILSPIFAFAVILIGIGILAVVVALRRWGK